jgi:hypothetical protein
LAHANALRQQRLLTASHVQRLVIPKRISTHRISKPMPRATQRMPPIHPPMSQMPGPLVMQMAMFLPQFVREKKGDDKQRNDQKSAQYHLLDHGSLQSQEHDFIVEQRTCPYVARRS